MARTKGTYSLPGNIETFASAPLDARTVVATEADLIIASNFPYPYVGMPVVDKSTGNMWILTADDVTVKANWKKVGGDASGGATYETKGTVKPDGSTIILENPSDPDDGTIEVNTDVIATQEDITDVNNSIDAIDLSVPTLVEFTEDELFSIIWEDLDIEAKPEYTEADLDDIIAQIDFSGGGISGLKNAYTKVKVGLTELTASGADTLELIQGSGVILTPDSTNKTVTIASTASATEMTNADMMTIWNTVFPS